MRIAVLTDSSADISIQEAQEKNIHVLRFPLVIDGEEHIEETTITLEEFTNKMYAGAVAKTSQPTLGTLLSTWDKLLEDYDHVLYACITVGISGAYQTALAQARNYEGKVTVLDTRTVAAPYRQLCTDIVAMVEKGYSPEEIKTIVEGAEKMLGFIIPGDLEYLRRGGRISPQAAALGNLLKIVPILIIKEGHIDVLDKVRTKRKAISKIISYATKDKNAKDYHWYVIHADAHDLAQEVADELKEVITEPIEIEYFYPVIMSHTGPGTVAIACKPKLSY